MEGTENVSDILVDNITRLMAARNTNPAATSIKAKLGQTAVYDIVTRKSLNPRVDTLAKIAKALDYPVSDLFLTQKQIQSREEVLSLMQALPDETKLALKALISATR